MSASSEAWQHRAGSASAFALTPEISGLA